MHPKLKAWHEIALSGCILDGDVVIAVLISWETSIAPCESETAQVPGVRYSSAESLPASGAVLSDSDVDPQDPT
jgi:hypothetical protein